jgi:hypothetical protein
VLSGHSADREKRNIGWPLSATVAATAILNAVKGSGRVSVGRVVHPSVDLSGSDRRSRAGQCGGRIRFSVAMYSFWSSNSRLTRPVTYVSSRSHLYATLVEIMKATD